MIIYKEMTADELDVSVFASFDRTQIVTKCWRKVDVEWIIKEAPFIDNWTQEKYREGVLYLKDLVHAGGYVVGAFCGGR